MCEDENSLSPASDYMAVHYLRDSLRITLHVGNSRKTTAENPRFALLTEDELAEFLATSDKQQGC